jgi:hypothetical protein
LTSYPAYAIVGLEVREMNKYTITIWHGRKRSFYFVCKGEDVLKTCYSLAAARAYVERFTRRAK